MFVFYILRTLRLFSIVVLTSVFLQSCSDPSSKNEAPTPLLTLSEILQTSEVKSALKQAVLANDDNALKDWQQQIIMVAKEAYVTESEMSLVEGITGIDFLRFTARRELFNDRFMQAYIYFEPVDTIYVDFPEMSDLHERGNELIKQRTRLIEEARQLLKEQGETGNLERKAKNQWQDYMKQKGGYAYLLDINLSLNLYI